MLDVRDKKYAICSADGAILAAYNDVEDAKIDYADLIKDGHEGLRIFEVIHTYPFEDAYVIKILKEIEVAIESDEEESVASHEDEEKIDKSEEDTKSETVSADSEGEEEIKEEDEGKKE